MSDTNEQNKRRKRIILILIIVFGIVAFAGGSKITNRPTADTPEVAQTESATSTNNAPDVSGGSTAPIAPLSAGHATTTPTPGQSSTPGEQSLSSVATDTATPSPSPTASPSPTVTATTNPSPQPTPTSSPIMQNSGVHGRMMRASGDCGLHTGTCLPAAYQGVASLYRSAGNEYIKQVAAQGDGAFWVVLDPGTYYFIHTGSPTLEKTTFTVPTNSFATLTLTFK